MSRITNSPLLKRGLWQVIEVPNFPPRFVCPQNFGLDGLSSCCIRHQLHPRRFRI